MATSIGNLVVYLTANDSKFKRSMLNAQQSIRNIAGDIKTWAAGYLTLRTAQEAVKLARFGAEVEREGARFRAFAGGAEEAAKMLAAFQLGAGGVADKMTSMQVGGKLLQMGIVGSADEMEQLVEMASRLGKQTDSLDQRVGDFAATLANQSMPRLDNFGISSGNVRARIDELMKSTAGLTREQAFLKAVFEEGGKALDRLGARTEDSLTMFEKMDANISNMKATVGSGLVPAFDALATSFAGITASADGITSEKITRGLAEVLDWVGRLYDAFAAFFKFGQAGFELIIGLFIGDLEKVLKTMEEVINTFKPIGEEIDITPDFMSGLGDELFADAQTHAGEASDALSRVLAPDRHPWAQAVLDSLAKLQNAANVTAPALAMTADALEEVAGPNALQAMLNDLAAEGLLAQRRDVVGGPGIPSAAERGSVEFFRATTGLTSAADRAAAAALREQQRNTKAIEENNALLEREAEAIRQNTPFGSITTFLIPVM